MSNKKHDTVGKISLAIAVGGIVVPILIAFLVRIFVKTNNEPYYMLCCLLFAGLEVIGLITGIVGRRSACGKAGLIISAVCTVLAALAIPYFTCTNPIEVSEQKAHIHVMLMEPNLLLKKNETA
ncbi:MAG: hypothetical protein KAS17_04665 [Victivallaceae bacterium]|nr:hypothetical protein [Victivallaceae bacterium]